MRGIHIAVAFGLAGSVGACDAPPTPISETDLVFLWNTPGGPEAMWDHGAPDTNDGIVFVGSRWVRFRTGEGAFQLPEARLGVPGVARNWIRPSPDVAAFVATDSTGLQEWTASSLTGVAGFPEPSHLERVPTDVHPVWSPDGGRVAYVDPAEPDHVVVHQQDGSLVRFPTESGGVIDLAWRVGSPELVLVLGNSEGSASLTLMSPDDGTVSTVVETVDGPAQKLGAALEVTPSGRSAVLSAVAVGQVLGGATDGTADRDLDLFEIDLTDGTSRQLVDSPFDDHHPRLQGETLYWTATEVYTDIVVVPTSGGEPQMIVEGAMRPTWHPDGDRLGVLTGSMRGGDWGRNLTGAVLTIDEAMAASGDPSPWPGSAPSFAPPSWSADGEWIGFVGQAPGEDSNARAAFVQRTDEQGSPIPITDVTGMLASVVWGPEPGRALVSGDEGTAPQAASFDPQAGSLIGTQSLRLPRGVTQVHGIAWADDGRIAIEAQEADTVHALWVVTPELGAGRATAYVMQTTGGVSWIPGQPDRLILSAQHEGTLRLFSLTTSGQGITPISPEGRHLIHPAVSPDGQWVAATETSVRRQIRRMPLTLP